MKQESEAKEDEEVNHVMGSEPKEKLDQLIAGEVAAEPVPLVVQKEEESKEEA